MKLKAWMLAGVLSAAPILLTFAARADVYHAVEPGDTLSSVAARYGMQVDRLREVNGLTNTSDTAPLPAMLLRIPDAASSGAASSGAAFNDAGPNKAAVVPPGRSDRGDDSAFSGSISTSVRYTMRPGDTIDSVATRYAHAGYSVTGAEIRSRNQLSGDPAVGSAIIVPLQTSIYRGDGVATRPASSHTPAAGSGAGAAGEGTRVSDTVALPLAEMAPSSQPVYQAPSLSRALRRGPTLLASRGDYPGATLDGVRIISPEEDVPNPGPTHDRPTVMRAPRAVFANNLARVAQVAAQGGRIRRLPDAAAVTLYHCPVGTELAVIRQNGPWSAILMSDRSTGWIPTRYLHFTSNSVDISAIALSTVSMQTNSTVHVYHGNYTSSNPIVAQALTWLGTPYRYGGEGRNGIDCSSLVQHAFRACGYNLPRTAAEQARIGQAIDPAHLQAGDRLYFSKSGTRIDHTGLYMGDGYFVQASGRGRQVIVSNLYDTNNWNIFVGARR